MALISVILYKSYLHLTNLEGWIVLRPNEHTRSSEKINIMYRDNSMFMLVSHLFTYLSEKQPTWRKYCTYCVGKWRGTVPGLD